MLKDKPWTIRCPVCGGKVQVQHEDKVNRCEFCASPVLGPSQSRDCVNHSGTLAKGVCNVCGDLICEECMQTRVGEYGGKLFTLVNCTKQKCIVESSWAREVNEKYEKLTDMSWSDRIDNIILRVTGLGAVLMMIFELIFVITMLSIQYFTPFGLAEPPYIPYFFIRGDAVIVLSILGNFLSAIILQTALQVYIHDRQLGAGITLLVFLIIEAALLIGRGLYFNLLSLSVDLIWVVPLFLGAFTIATVMIFCGSLLAIYIGYKKRKQLQHAREELGLE